MIFWIIICAIVGLLLTIASPGRAVIILDKLSCLISYVIYLLKYVSLWTLISLRQRGARRAKGSRNDKSEYMFPSKNEEQKERRKFPKGTHANDTIAFQGADSAGNHVLIRMAIRDNGHMEIWLVLRLLGGDGNPVMYAHAAHPNGIVLEGNDEEGWSAAGLQCHVRQPMKQWRIAYSGWIRQLSGTINHPVDGKFDGRCQHLQMSFIWNALSDEIDFDCDLSASLTAQCIAENKFSRPFFDTLRSMHETRYEQWGQMIGTVTLDDNPESTLKLRGMRDHCYGMRDWHKYNRYIAVMGLCTDGTFFHVGLVSIKGGIHEFKYGYVGTDTLEIHAITDCSMKFDQLGPDGKPPYSFAMNFIAGDVQYECIVQVNSEVQVFNGRNWESKSYLRFLDIRLNSVAGTGFSEFEYASRDILIPQNDNLVSPIIPVIKTSQLNIEDQNHLVVALTHRVCLCEAMVGGKAMQLGQLMQLQNNFTVPKGLVLTTHAFHEFLTGEVALKEALKVFSNPVRMNLKDENIELIEECFRGAHLFTALQNDLIRQLIRIFGPDYNKCKFAVRSSACGEDGCSSSSAGQMETFLNVVGLDQITKKIILCWASAFTKQALQYNRQNGVSLMSEMGVVVQEMVPATVSGIMFTCDPRTGNSSTLFINATKGLGEGVASGVIEPDTIVMQRSYDNPKEFALHPKSPCKQKDSCLWDGQITLLTQVGWQLENIFNSPRDIEWAFDDVGQLFILQSRPVTGLNQETDVELQHEFDSPTYSDIQYTTTHNAGEVMPGVISPLGISVACNGVDKAIQYQLVENGIMSKMHSQMEVLMSICSRKALLNLTQGLHRDPSIGADPHTRKVMDICIMGRPYHDKNLDELLLKKYGNQRFLAVKGVLKSLKMLYTSSRRQKSLGDLVKQLKRDEVTLTEPPQIINQIEDLFKAYVQGWLTHSGVSGISVMYYHILFAILKANASTNIDDVMSDIASIYASCDDVESADIPKSLQKLAEQVCKESGAPINAKSDEEWLIWLKSEESGKCKVLFNEFIKRHGHRCISEIDLVEKTWAEEPLKLVQSIKAACGRLQQQQKSPGPMKQIKIDKKKLTSIQIINNMKTPLNSGQKLALRYILPKAQQAVANREFTKALSIRVSHHVRVLYRRLSKILHERNVIPDSSLMYNMTHYEIHTLVTQPQHSVNLIRKARRRARLTPKLSTVVLGEINIGYPIITSSVATNMGEREGNLVTGTVVSSGVTVARACVCYSLQDATNIKMGDILIAYSTDIAWSLYFPSLSGVVTELGGLLSHGAVVAREYGLPCVVSAKGALQIFKTGDMCRLNAGEGSITKIESFSS